MDAGARYLDLLEQTLTHTAYSQLDIGRPGGNPVSRRILRALRRASVVPLRMTPHDAAIRAVGKDWPVFAHTMVGVQRLRHARRCVEPCWPRACRAISSSRQTGPHAVQQPRAVGEAGFDAAAMRADADIGLEHEIGSLGVRRPVGREMQPAVGQMRAQGPRRVALPRSGGVPNR